MTEQLTLLVTYKDKEKAQWLWDIFKKYPEEVNGIKISAISNGDLFTVVQCLEEIIEIYRNNLNKAVLDGSYGDDELEEDELEDRVKLRELEKKIKNSRRRLLEE